MRLTSKMLWAVLLAAAIMVPSGLPAMAQAQDAAKESPPTTEATASLAMALDAMVAEAREATWQWKPDESVSIKLRPLLKKAESHHPLVLHAKSRLAETEAKQDGVESKRVLFFFKYFDARYLEGSAELDVQAAQAQVRAARQQALRLTVSDYLALVKATVNSAVAHADWQYQAGLVNQAQQQFVAGDITGLQLNTVAHQLLAAKQSALAARVQQAAACRPLRVLLQKSPKGTCHITDVSIRATDVLPLTDDWQALEATVARAVPTHWEFAQLNPLLPIGGELRDHVDERPDVQALAYRVDALEKLVKASSVKMDVTQAKVLKATIDSGQLHHKQQIEKAMIQLEDALLASELSQPAVTTAHLLWQLAARNLHQTRVSLTAGFASQLEAEAARLAYIKAQQVWVQAQATAAQTQVDVLAASGLLTTTMLSPQD